MHLKKVKYVLLSLIFINLTSCATTKVNEFYNNLAPLIEQQNISGAVSFAEDFYKNCDKYNKLLYSLELAFLYHLNKDYKNSNTFFEHAKYLYSLKDYTSTIFNNDTLLPKYYLGENFEMAYTNFFCALNYIKLRKRNEAVVEARQTNNLFNKIKIDDENNIYKDDPFIRYFMGLVYQNAGYLNDAMVSYKLALRAYEDYNIAQENVPEDLINNLYNVYKYYYLNEEAEILKQKYPYVKETNFKTDGNLFIINYNGLAPKRTELVVTVPLDEAWRKYYKRDNDYRYKVMREFDLYYISASFPKYEKYPNEIVSFDVEAVPEDDETQKFKYKSYPATDISLIMEKVLDINYKTTFYSRINSYVLGLKEIEEVEYLYGQKKAEILTDPRMKKNREKLLEDLEKETERKIYDIKRGLDNLNSVDLKSWRSIPEKVNMAKINLKPGKYNIIIKYLDEFDNIVEIEKKKIKIRKGRNRFLILKSYKEPI